MKITESMTDQLMVMAAFRYCLGRMTYIVGVCNEWLRDIWPNLSEATQTVIFRDFIESYLDDRLGSAYDAKSWVDTFTLVWGQLDRDTKKTIKDLISWKIVVTTRNNKMAEDKKLFLEKLWSRMD